MYSSVHGWLWWVCILLYVPACLGLIAVVLLQKGKGVGFAGAFGLGGGGADTVFGPRMSKSLPVKLTYVAAAMFLLLALAMSLLSGRITKGQAPELVKPETIDMSGYEEAGIGAAPGAPAAASEAVETGTTAPAAAEKSAPAEPAAAVVDESPAETPVGGSGEASPPPAQ
ncbi:MAG TPA: preprotein translocase subunit SecG [Candidatus Hydrogenedentes bacterium]|jgi:preprotein translocase subunit SecG|nr:preprotein translocase subunit SecG [Candidatus Hydrogenedentota bacterium]HPJ98293.1 preprotein translocase subunit SecG [Candidatus Hydrogenedentota bacterium]